MRKNRLFTVWPALLQRRGLFLAVVLAASTLLILSGCAPATTPAAAQPPAAALAATATTPSKPTEPPAATATKAPAAEKPAATATQAAAPTATQAPDAKPAAVSFAKDVKPIFDQNCVKCHGGASTEVSLKLNSYAGVMAGSENGPVIVSGKAADSELIKLVLAGKMPKRANRLPDAQLKILQDWVNAGAPNN